MDTKSTVYISGGEVKVVTLLDKLGPDFWISGDQAHIIKEPTTVPVSFQTTLNRLVREVRNQINSRGRQGEEVPAASDFEAFTDIAKTPYLSNSQRRQGVSFAHAAVGFLHGFRRTGLAFGKFMHLMIMTPVL